jgi:hypothetical protein
MRPIPADTMRCARVHERASERSNGARENEREREREREREGEGGREIPWIHNTHTISARTEITGKESALSDDSNDYVAVKGRQSNDSDAPLKNRPSNATSLHAGDYSCGFSRTVGPAATKANHETGKGISFLDPNDLSSRATRVTTTLVGYLATPRGASPRFPFPLPLFLTERSMIRTARTKIQVFRGIAAPRAE